METVIIREIQPNDNTEVVIVLQKVLVDLGVPKIGSVYEDLGLDNIYENYDVAKTGYFVLEVQGMIIACTGIAKFGCRNSFEYAFKGN